MQSPYHPRSNPPSQGQRQAVQMVEARQQVSHASVPGTSHDPFRHYRPCEFSSPSQAPPATSFPQNTITLVSGEVIKASNLQAKDVPQAAPQMNQGSTGLLSRPAAPIPTSATVATSSSTNAGVPMHVGSGSQFSQHTAPANTPMSYEQQREYIEVRQRGTWPSQPRRHTVDGAPGTSQPIQVIQQPRNTVAVGSATAPAAPRMPTSGGPYPSTRTPTSHGYQTIPSLSSSSPTQPNQVPQHPQYPMTPLAPHNAYTPQRPQQTHPVSQPQPPPLSHPQTQRHPIAGPSRIQTSQQPQPVHLGSQQSSHFSSQPQPPPLAHPQAQSHPIAGPSRLYTAQQSQQTQLGSQQLPRSTSQPQFPSQVSSQALPPQQAHSVSPSMAHASSILRTTASLLEQVYHTTQASVAAELDRLNSFCTEHGRRAQQLTDQVQAVTKERDDARMETELLKGRLIPVMQTLKQLVMDKSVLTEEAKKLREMNAMLAKMIRKNGGNMPVSAGDVDNEREEGDGAMTTLGPYQVPEALARALSDAVTSTLSDQFEQRMVQMLLEHSTERAKLLKENALLKALVDTNNRNSGAKPTLPPSPLTAPSSMPSESPRLAPNAPPLVSTSLSLQPPASTLMTPPAERLINAPLHAPQPDKDASPSAPPTAPASPHRLALAELDRSVESLPTPARTASPHPPPDVELVLQSVTQIKQEQMDGAMAWPWAPEEVVDLTTISEDEFLNAVSSSGERALQQQLLEVDELVASLGASSSGASQGDHAGQAATGEQGGEFSGDDATLAPEAIGTSQAEKKRGLEEEMVADAHINEVARKRQRLDTTHSGDVEMSDAHGPSEVAARTEPTASSLTDCEGGKSAPSDDVIMDPPPDDESLGPAEARAKADAPREIASSDDSPAETATPMQLLPVDQSQLGMPTLISPLASEPILLSCPPTLPALQPSGLDAIQPHTVSSTVQSLPVSQVQAKVKQEPLDSRPRLDPVPSTSSATEDVKPPTTPAPKFKFGLAQLEAAYHASGDRMSCRMCIHRKNKNDPTYTVRVFSKKASSWLELEGHVENDHPAAYQKILEMSPADLAEMKQRMKQAMLEKRAN